MDWLPPLFILWLGLAVLFGLLEIFTVGFYFLLFAGGALITALVAIFVASLPAQIIVFVLVSLLLVLYVRPIVRQTFNVSDTLVKESNINALIGTEAVVLEPVTRLGGRVKLVNAGEIWSASLADVETAESLPQGAEVLIVSVDGARLMVRSKDSVNA